MSAAPIAPKDVRVRSFPSPSSRNDAHHAAAAAPNSASARVAGDAVVASASRSATLRDAAGANASRTPAQQQRAAALVDALLAKVPAADRSAAKTAIPAILDAARESGNGDPNRIAYLLATAQTESDFGTNMTEKGHSKGWFNASYGCADGNRPGTADGYAYRGRGYVQITHAGRYAELSHRLGLADERSAESGRLEPALVAHPERLAEPKLAAEALVIGVQRNMFTHNASAALDTTIPAGRKPGDVDFYHARGLVNGIVKEQAERLAKHATEYAQILDGYRHSVLSEPATK